MTVFFATSFIDLNSWVITNVPGLGNLELSQFWGSQPLYVSFQEQENGTGSKRVYFDMVLASVDAKDVDVEATVLHGRRHKDEHPVSSGEDVKETVVEWADAEVEEPFSFLRFCNNFLIQFNTGGVISSLECCIHKS